MSKIEYSPKNGLDFGYDTTGQDLVIKMLDCETLGLQSAQNRINQLKSKI